MQDIGEITAHISGAQGTQVALQVKQGPYIRRVTLVRRALGAPPPTLSQSTRPNANGWQSPRHGAPMQGDRAWDDVLPSSMTGPASSHLPLSFFQHGN